MWRTNTMNSNFSEVIISKCSKHGSLTSNQCYKNGFSKIKKKQQWKCKKCNEETKKRYKEKDPEHYKKLQKKYYSNREKYRDSNEAISYFRVRLKKKFNITLEEYEEMINKQKNKCKICKRNPIEIKLKSGKKRPLCVDHCHKTGKVRGLLCFKCNGMLGMAEDSLQTLRCAIEYLTPSWS